MDHSIKVGEITGGANDGSLDTESIGDLIAYKNNYMNYLPRKLLTLATYTV